MSPPRSEGKALTATEGNVAAQGAGKKLTRGKRLSKEQSVKIQKEHLERLQRNQKRRADRKITRMLNKLSINPNVEKKRKRIIKQRREKRVEKTIKMDPDLEQENTVNQHK